MIWQLIKKELLLFWRRPRELVVLLLMPFVLITILGAALGAINDGESPNLDIKLAIWQQDDIDKGEESFITQLENFGLSDEEKNAAIGGIRSFNPIQILYDEVLDNEELKGLIEVVHVERELTEAEAQDYSGILEIPSDFTEQFFLHVFLNEGESPKLTLKLNESSSLEGSVLRDIFTTFQDEISFWTTIQSIGIYGEELREELATTVGKTTTVSEKAAIDSVSYYAIGMSVMFMFYVAGTAATLAFEEKENQIYGRILLANMPVPVFFTGVFVSTIVVTFIQINILFGLSRLIHGVTWPNLLDYAVVSTLLSVMVGAFAVFIAAISYRINSGGAVQVFSNFLIPIIAFVGGSFLPVAQLGGLFETISKFSPAGSGISAYYKIMQGYSLGDVAVQLLAISVTTLSLLFLAFMIQSRRGETA